MVPLSYAVPLVPGETLGQASTSPFPRDGHGPLAAPVPLGASPHPPVLPLASPRPPHFLPEGCGRWELQTVVFPVLTDRDIYLLFKNLGPEGVGEWCTSTLDFSPA